MRALVYEFTDMSTPDKKHTTMSQTLSKGFGAVQTDAVKGLGMPKGPAFLNYSAPSSLAICTPGTAL
jgi:hypothetical protein